MRGHVQFSKIVVWVAAIMLLATALYQNYLVAHRVTGALWQWYKFKDYGRGGHITLSRGTSLWFYILSASLFLCSAALAYSYRKGNRPLRRVLTSSSLLFALGLLIYFLLASGHLSVWRP
jgi:hypothetical protein